MTLLQPGPRITRLDNGLQVVTETMPDVRSVALGFWVGTGSRDEAGPVAGVSHFLEHLLFKGTPTRTAREIAESIDAVGGDLNAFTTKEHTAFYVRVLDRNLDLGFGILSDIMREPAFRPEEIDSERQVILEELLMHIDEPDDLVHDMLHEVLFPGHELGREVLGDTDTINAMARDDIADFFSHHYRPANMVVAAAGRLDHDEFVAQVAADFAGADGGVAPPREAPPVMHAPVVTVLPRSTEQAHLVIGLRAMSADDPDRYALALATHVLGGGTSSRLFQEVRERRGLAYSVYAYRTGYHDAGMMAVYAGTAPARAREVLDVLHGELDRMATDGITDSELALAKGHVAGTTALGLEDSGARMSRIGSALLTHGEVVGLEELAERWENVSADDVARAIERVLTGPRALAVIGPFEEDAFAGPGARVA